MTGQPQADLQERYLWACDHPLSILIVDDDESDRKHISHFLRGINPDFDVRTAQAAVEALEAHQRAPADCVLLDYYLPDQNANAFVGELSATDPSTAIVVLSGTSRYEVLAELLSLGATDYLLKSELAVQPLREIINKAVLRATHAGASH